jgi:hypothetical protein
LGEYVASIFRFKKQARQTNMKQALLAAYVMLVSYLDIIPWGLLKINQRFRGICLLGMPVTFKELHGVMSQKIELFKITNMRSYIVTQLARKFTVFYVNQRFINV